jgi:hypothetical protein
LEAEKALGESFDDFAGQWVAIVNHAVVQHDATLNALLDRVDAEKVDRIQHVAAEKTAFCFF